MSRGSERERRPGRRAIAAFVVLSALAVASCASNDDSSGGAATSAAADGTTTAPGGEATTAPGGTGGASTTTGKVDTKPLVIARNMDLTSMDPGRLVCDTCQFVFTSLYQTLVGLDKDNKTLIPDLAASWDINSDSTKYTFHLDPKAKFSDASPVESKDVKFSLLRLKNLKVSLTYLVDDITSIDTPDAQTAVVTLAKPNAEFLNNMNAAYTVILNSDVVAANGGTADDNADTTDKAENWFLTNSAGSGPYVLDTFAQGDHLTIKANPNYWKAPAPISTVTVQQTETAAAQAQMLQTGDADIAMQVDPITAKSLDGVKDVKVETIPSFNFLYVALWPGITVGTSHPLDDKVRQAIRMGIDYQALIDTLLNSKGKTQASPIPNGFPGSDGLAMPKTDPAAAKKMLADAGAADLKLTLGYPTINAYGIDFSQLAQLLQQQLAEIGVSLTLAPDTFAVMIDKYRSQQLSSNLLYWAPDYYGSAQYVSYFGLVAGARAAKNAGGGNDTPLIDPVTTKAYAAALASTEPVERAKQYGIAGTQMLNQNIVIPLVSPDLVLAYRSDVSGVTYSACCNIVLDQIRRSG